MGEYLNSCFFTIAVTEKIWYNIIYGNIFLIKERIFL